MTRSENLDQLLPALIAARAKMPRIAKDQTAIVESRDRGTRYSYGYADLAAVLEAVTPALSANGLAVVQSPHVTDGAVVIDTLLYHATGQWIAADPLAMPLPGAGAQAIGSAITYGRRYALLALLGLAAAGEDDDGATADEKARRTTPAPKGAAPKQADLPAPGPEDRKPKPEVVAEARTQLEKAAGRGMALLVSQLNATRPAILTAIGAGVIAELKRQAKQADSETPA